MTLVLVLRPQPGADATVDRARALGLDAVAASLFDIVPLDWSPPDPALYDAVLMTSANAARFGGEALSRYCHLPLFAVGRPTETAARAAGFVDITTGHGDGAAILDLAVAEGKTRLLHLAGREHKNLRHPQILIDRRIVYASEEIDTLPSRARHAIERGAVVLLHSSRAATLFGRLVDKEGLDRGQTTIIGLSGAARDAAGTGWAGTFAAPKPTDDALLAIAARLCDQAQDGSGRAQDREDQA